MAAFAMGLIGDASVADTLIAALGDADPFVQGRAAEGLGLIGHKAAADPIAAMMATHVKAGALANIPADDLVYPKAPPVEAVRLGMYALVRLGAFDQLASVLTSGGQPVTRWWPVAYAFRRVGNPTGRACPARAPAGRRRVHAERLPREDWARSKKRGRSRRSWRFWATRPKWSTSASKPHARSSIWAPRKPPTRWRRF